MVAIDKDFDEDQILATDVNGFVCFAPVGTTAPDDATADYPAGWASLGLILDDGVTETLTKDMEEKMAWNVRGVIKRIAKSAKFSFKFTAVQTSADLHELYYGNRPTAISGSTGHTSTKIAAKSVVKEWAWIIEKPMDNGTVERTIVPRGVVTDTGDIVSSETSIKQYELTVGAQISPGVDYIAEILSNDPALVDA